MHQDYCETESHDEEYDDDENCAAPQEVTCHKHFSQPLDRFGKCILCDLLRGKNRRYTKGRF